MGILAASLIFAQSTFASGNSIQAGVACGSVSDGSFQLPDLVTKAQSGHP